MTIASLFNRKVHTTLDVAALEGGKKLAEALIVESARTLLASKDDAPLAIHEVEGGFVVAGTHSAILFADTGDVESKAIPASSATDKPVTEAKAGEKFDLKHDGKLAVTGTEPELLAWIHKKHSFSMSHALAYEGYSIHKAAKPVVKEAEGIPDKDLPGGAIMAIKNVVQASHDRIQAAMHEGVLTEAQLDEYMQVAPLIPYEKPLKSDGARVSIGGCSIYLSNDDFFAKVPHYGVADYLMGLALKEVIEDGKLDVFVKALRAQLAGSAKVKALDVELAESEAAPVAKPVTESVVEDTEKSDQPDSVLIVVSDEAVELRAENEEGALIASAAYNKGDKKSLAAAEAEIANTAKELGYEVEEAVIVDATTVLVEAALADASVMGCDDYKALSEALDSGDAAAFEKAVQAVTDPRLKALSEGLSSRKHVKGRKPSGLTLPRKALAIKVPKDVGPGSNESVQGGWLETVRAMSVPEFAAHMLEAVSTDTAEVFQARVDALVEGYAAGVGQKDIARKITAVNPIIKKRLGKGLDMESIAKTAPVVETVMVAIPSDILDAVLESARKGGALQESEVRISGETIQVRLPKALAAKLTVDFPRVKLA